MSPIERAVKSGEIEQHKFRKHGVFLLGGCHVLPRRALASPI